MTSAATTDAATPAPEDSETPGDGPLPPHDRRLRVLLIEDDPDFRSFFLRAASNARWSALAVDSPERGLATLESFAPHLIFLDLSFPDMDGLTVLSELAPRASTIALALLSGADPEVMRSAHRIGQRLGLRMLDPLPKPVSAAMLRGALSAFEQENHSITPDAIGGAISQQVLTLAYQPKVCLATGTYQGPEALVRWPTDDRVIPPAQFVPAVERDAGLSLRLLRYVVARAVSESACWRGDGVRCAVNMSALCLLDARLADLLCDTLRAAGGRPQDFTLELTETAALQDPGRVERTLTALRLRGFFISMDDFGTGHSSLMHLQRLPFNEIKIDQTFIAEMLDDNRANQIVRLVVNLGRTLGAKTVAEGIEGAAQAEALRDMGCELAQGFLFARPMAPDDLVAWRREQGP